MVSRFEQCFHPRSRSHFGAPTDLLHSVVAFGHSVFVRRVGKMLKSVLVKRNGSSNVVQTAWSSKHERENQAAPSSLIGHDVVSKNWCRKSQKATRKHGKMRFLFGILEDAENRSMNPLGFDTWISWRFDSFGSHAPTLRNPRKIP